ncbi:MAG: HlyD family efflux transporter periplasmic adaptor subunit [Pseudomonadota bacterium]
MQQTLKHLTLAALLAMFFSAPVQAGEGHDHGDAAPSAGTNAPRRLPDGGVFLPKISQRQLGVRTVVATADSLPKTMELAGHVVMDPNAGGRVQPSIAGRIEPGPRGFPALGQPVRKGEVLAVVRASASPIERANQVAQSAELRAQLDLARKRAARFAQLEGTIAQKDQDAARSDVFSLEQRLVAVQASVSATEPLVAPVAGVVATSNVVAGQVVEARELLFEIIDPARLTIEASAFDASLIGNIAGASVGTPGGKDSIPLQFTGAGRSLREGAIPLQFRTTGKSPLPLAVNQPVKVIVQTKELVQGFAVPASAIAKNPSNQDIVWVHTGAETFVPRPVRSVALDGARVSVLDGLTAGERVVTQGAALINQVR